MAGQNRIFFILFLGDEFIQIGLKYVGKGFQVPKLCYSVLDLDFLPLPTFEYPTILQLI